MSNLAFNTANQTFQQLFGNGLTYQISHLQPDYGWEQNHWEDIQKTLKLDGEPAHHMGYLILQTQNSKLFDVDGQRPYRIMSRCLLFY